MKINNSKAVNIGGTRFINLTPHPVIYRNKKGEDIFICSAGKVRLKTKSKKIDELFTKTEYKDIVGLPKKSKKGTYYIVSLLSLLSLKGRKDICSPNTDDSCIRSEAGFIQAITGFTIV